MAEPIPPSQGATPQERLVAPNPESAAGPESSLGIPRGRSNSGILKISEISEQEREEIYQVALSWKGLAKLKIQKVPDSRVLKDSRDICSRISEIALYPDTCGFVCRNGQGEIQAIGLYSSEDCGTIKLLATHPDNLRHEVNNSIPNRTRGAASAILVAFIYKAFEEKFDLKLTALGESAPFYRRFSFVPENPDTIDSAMVLTLDKIKRLLHQRQGPECMPGAGMS